ncbi:MAG: DUF456 domain-containing protein [Kiritimatiellae bacterium]|nr:DUF456 domain-containing protein [Kiritimatiellia bacterium]
MTVLMSVAGGLLLALGLVGCVVPVLPGPLVAYSSLWVLVAFGASPGTERLAVGGVVVLAVMAVDYVLPSVMAGKFKCSKSGVFGCVVGTFAGLFFLPVGLVAGPFLGTVAGELIAGKRLGESLKGGLGALIGFVLCLFAKLAAVALFAWWFFAAVGWR